MDINLFWAIVDSAKQRAAGDLDARVETLERLLVEEDLAGLQAFQNIYDDLIRQAYRWDLWGAAYVMNGGSSDDGFLYFRAWLISEGRSTFESALASPDSLAALPRVEIAELELFGYVALRVYEQKGGGEIARTSTIELTMPAGQEWSEEQLPTLFPALTKKYG